MTRRLNILIKRFLLWRTRNVSERNFLLTLSLLVGLATGLAAVLLKNTIHWVQVYATSFLHQGFGQNYLLLVFPMIGIFLTILFVKYIVRDDIGHGVTKILHSISQSSGYLKFRNVFASIFASSLTIGMGGSVGAEGPIVLTGASIGSSIGQLLSLNYRTVKLLIGCGAAGAIAGIFKAPIAGLAFTLEILMLDLTMVSIVPLLIAAVTSASVAYFFLGEGVEFSYSLITPFNLANIPYYIVLGLACGFISLYFSRMLMFIEKRFVLMSNVWIKWLVGGSILSFLIFLFPPLYGEGYHTITALLNGSSTVLVENSLFYEFRDSTVVIMLFLFALMLLKVFATALTTGSGGVGGTFAPSLFLGGVTGYFVAFVFNLTGWISLPLANFSLVGMAGVMSGVMHAPLMAIFLIAEITNGYGLFIPLMITAVISYLTIKIFEPHSIYTKRLAMRGQLITHHKDRAVLTLMRLNKVVETDFKPISPNATLGELVKLISSAKRNIFPVVTDLDELEGIVLLDDVRSIMFDGEIYNTTLVSQLASVPPAFIQVTDTMDEVMKKFESTGAWNLPVVEGKKYVGFVSKSKILTAYRELLIEFSEE